MLVNGRAAISYRLRKLIVRPREHTRRNTHAAGLAEKWNACRYTGTKVHNTKYNNNTCTRR